MLQKMEQFLHVEELFAACIERLTTFEHIDYALKIEYLSHILFSFSCSP